MYYFQHYKTELSTPQLRGLADRFEAVQTTQDLAELLKRPEPALKKLAEAPQYFEFYIPKPGGERRYIQNPEPALKSLQSELNRYLQAVYYFVRPDSAHGFLISPNDETQPRNIYTNALAHVRGHWFLNIDLRDFFHTVTARHVSTLFQYTLGFPAPVSDLLTRLSCCKSCLPMGAPSSPVVSNWVLYFLDREFEQMAREREGVYTRYADDLTFSFPRPPEDGFLDLLRHSLLKNGFQINDKKLRLQGRLEQPEITGLCVGKGPRPMLSKSYLKTLKKELGIYRWLVSEASQRRGLFQSWLFDQFRRSLAGQVEFAGFVLGKGDRGYQKLVGKLQWG
jgi:RNA-directed DNA polymerase